MLSIAGAGLAGLLAAHAWPQAKVYEPQQPRAEHRALLRFRSDAVGRLVGIEFKPVTVRKGVWYKGRYVVPDIRLANMYSRKCLGSVEGERSVWNLEPANRFIAPESLYEQLVDTVGGRVSWGEAYDYSQGEPVISTAPLPIVIRALGIETDLNFRRAAIHVSRYRIPHCNVFQTVYFPDVNLSIYRASITGDLLIIEAVRAPDTLEISAVMEAFSLFDLFPLGTVEQKYGKIVPLETDQRKALLHRLTSEFRVYSLGRFATWRNVLLDDVVEDLAVIRRLLRTSEYDRSLHFS